MNSSQNSPLKNLSRRLGGLKAHLAAELAVSKGLLTQEELEAGLEQAEESGRSLVDILKLDTAALANDLRIEDLKSLIDSRRDLPPEIETARRDPSRRFGRFVIGSELGRGGMGIVYRAWQEDLGRWVALKVLKAEAAGSATARFLQEAQLAARVTHPHLVPIYEVAQEKGAPYIAMALLEGGSLDQRRLTVAEAIEIMSQVALAVDEIHRHGIVHRDIKPGNLLADGAGRVYLGDFGLARLRENPVPLSASGAFVGTLHFAPPEQVSGDRGRIGPTSDVYSLGATLYALASGHLPFEGSDFASMPHRILHEETTPMRKLRPEVPVDVDTICRRAMAKLPQDRYPSALEFARDLQRVQRGDPIAARPMSTVSRAVRSIWRRPAWIVAAIALAIAVGVLATGKAPVPQTPAPRLEAARRTIEESRRMLTGADAPKALERLARLASELERVPEAADLRGEALFLHGDLEAAESAFSQALATRAQDATVRHARGRVRLEQVLWLIQAGGTAADGADLRNRLDQAQADFEAAAKIGGPSFAAERLVEAHRAFLESRFDEGVRICEAEIAKGTPDFEYEVILGSSLLFLGQPKRALQTFTEAIRHRPVQAFAVWGRAFAAERSGDFELALQDLRRLTELRPAWHVPLENRSSLLHRLDRHEEALKDLDEAIRIAPARFINRATRLDLLVSLGRSKEAFAGAETLIAEHPGEATLYSTRGSLRLDAGDVAGATADFRKAISLDRTSPFAHVGMGRIHVGERRFQEAVDEFTVGLESKQHSVIRATWLHLRGSTYTQINSQAAWQSALEDFDHAWRLCSTNVIYLANRGIAHGVLGHKTEGMRDMEEAIRLQPTLEASLRPRIDALK